jgi:hypothetical protein
LTIGHSHEGVHIRRTGVRGRFGSWVLVGELFLDCAAFPEFAELVEGPPEDEVGLGAGAVHGFLLFFGALVHHGVEVEIFYGGEGFFYEAAAAKTPGGSHDFGGEGLFYGVSGSEFIH